MERLKKEHKEELESLKKEHEIEADRKRVAEMELQAENEKLKKDLKIEAAKGQVAEKQIHWKERKLQVANEKLEIENCMHVEEKIILIKKLEEGTKSLENLTRENEKLKQSLKKESDLINQLVASVNAVAAKRSSGEDSLPGGSEDEQNNQPPPKRAKYD